jgi:hypothetical protein
VARSNQDTGGVSRAATTGPGPVDIAPVAVGLCRCSTDRQEHSIADQETAIQMWASRERVALLRVFKDEGVSGLRLDRPGLLALLEFIAASPEKGVVVVWKRDRLIRPDEPVKGLFVEHRITELGWRLHYLAGQAPTGNSLADTLLSVVEHHASGEYLRKLGQDSIRGIVTRLHAGQAPGSKVPYGYAKAYLDSGGQIVRQFNRLEKHRKAPSEQSRFVLGDPLEVATVRWIFQEFVRGELSPAEIARQLEERGAPRTTPLRPWSASHVREILVRPAYVGDVVWNRESTATCVRWLDGDLSTKTKFHLSNRTGRLTSYSANDPKHHLVLRDRHPSIVSRELFARAAVVLLERAKDRDARNHTARCYGLTGVIFCGGCGGRLMGLGARRSNGRYYRYYHCKGDEHREDPARRSVHMRPLEDAIIQLLDEELGPLVRSSEAREMFARDASGRIARALPAADAEDEARRLLEWIRRLLGLDGTDDGRRRRLTLLGLVARVEVQWARAQGPNPFEMTAATILLRPGLPDKPLRLGPLAVPRRRSGL